MSHVLQPYEQYLPSSELSQELTVKDVFFSLEKLNEIFTSVSDRIGKRIEVAF